MRILLDMARMGSGGALQTSLTVLEHATRTPEHEWHAVLSPIVAQEFAEERDTALASVVRLGGGGSALSRMAGVRSAMPAIESRVRPDVVYTVFAPAFWMASAPHLLGFAWPHLLYPESPFVRSLTEWRSGLVGLRFRAKRMRQAQEVRRFEFLVVETKTVRRRLREVCGAMDKSIFVVRNSYTPLFESALRRRGSSPQGDRKIVLLPSDYRPHKNLESAPAVAEILVRRLGSEVELRLTCANQRIWRKIAADAERRGVADQVKNLGSVLHAEFAGAYAAADVVYLPTLLECSTAVYPESFIAGLPLVTSDLDFARELCGDAALYCDPYSADEAADRIERILGDPELANDLTAKGRVVLAREYPTPEEKWRSLLACLEEVAGSRPAS